MGSVVRVVDDTHSVVYVLDMSPKARFQLMIEPAQLAVLRQVQDATGAPVSAQIRRAIEEHLKHKKTGRKRVIPRPRP